MKEQVLSIDKFNNPMILENNPAIATLIIRLILLEPGKIQSHPDMGVGLVSRWRNCLEDELPDLQKEINDQMAKYLPELLVNDILVYYDNKYLVIQILLQDGNTYIFTTDDFKTLRLIDIM